MAGSRCTTVQPAVAAAARSEADQGRNDSAEAWSQNPWNRGGRRALEELAGLDEVVDLVEGERLELGDPADDVVGTQLAGVVQAHRGDHLGERVHGVAVVVVHALGLVRHDRAPAAAWGPGW